MCPTSGTFGLRWGLSFVMMRSSTTCGARFCPRSFAISATPAASRLPAACELAAHVRHLRPRQPHPKLRRRLRDPVARQPERRDAGEAAAAGAALGGGGGPAHHGNQQQAVAGVLEYWAAGIAATG